MKGYDRGSDSFIERIGFDRVPMPDVPVSRNGSGAANIRLFPRGLAELVAAGTRDRIERGASADRPIPGCRWCPGWVFSIRPDGSVHDGKRDFYADAFALFGLAWAYKLEPELRFLAAALAALQDLDRHFDAHGAPLVGFMPASTLYHVFLAVAEADRVWR